MGSIAGTDEASSVRKRAGHEASEWLIMLQDEPHDTELHGRFEQWRTSSPVNAAAWTQTSEIMDFVDMSEPVHQAYWQDLPDSRAAQRRRFSASYLPRPTWPQAAFAVAAVVLLWLTAPALILRMEADHITGTGEVRQIALADGSTVILSAGSAIRTDIGRDHREIRLLRGTALFEVRHDPSHPFRVEADGIQTTVLGTRFEVALNHDGGMVRVADGRVRVEYADGAPAVSEELGKGESLHVVRDGRAGRTAVSLGNVGAWKDGQLVLSDRPAREVIEALRPWYGGVIVARGTALDAKRLTGVYDIRDPAAAFAALARTPGIDVRHISRWVTIISVS